MGCMALTKKGHFRMTARQEDEDEKCAVESGGLHTDFSTSPSVSLSLSFFLLVATFPGFKALCVSRQRTLVFRRFSSTCSSVMNRISPMTGDSHHWWVLVEVATGNGEGKPGRKRTSLGG